MLHFQVFGLYLDSVFFDCLVSTFYVLEPFVF